MSTQRTWALIAVILLANLSSVTLAQEWGEKVVNFGTEIYYKGDVTKEDATKLGERLKESEFSDGTRKSIQLLKEEGVWQFRMVVLPEFAEDEMMRNTFRQMCLELSSHFEGEQVVVHICDNELKTLHVVKGLRGRLMMVDEAEVYRSGIEDEEFEKLSELLRAQGLTSNRVTFHVKKGEDQVDFRMVVLEQFHNDAGILEEVKGIAETMSRDVFGGETVEFHLCDEFLTSKNSTKGTGEK